MESHITHSNVAKNTRPLTQALRTELSCDTLTLQTPCPLNIPTMPSDPPTMHFNWLSTVVHPVSTESSKYALFV